MIVSSRPYPCEPCASQPFRPLGVSVSTAQGHPDIEPPHISHTRPSRPANHLRDDA